MAIGKAAATFYILNQYRVSDQRSGDKVDTAVKLSNVWGAPLMYAAGGWMAQRLVANPVTFVITAAYVEGAIVSDIIDPDEGLDNYVGFTLGGLGGGNDANYLTGDENESGYFNVYRNVTTILNANSTAATNAAAEKAYIANYWHQKDIQRWESMVMAYDTLSPSQQQAIRTRLMAALP